MMWLPATPLPGLRGCRGNRFLLLNAFDVCVTVVSDRNLLDVLLSEDPLGSDLTLKGRTAVLFVVPFFTWSSDILCSILSHPVPTFLIHSPLGVLSTLPLLILPVVLGSVPGGRGHGTALNRVPSLIGCQLSCSQDILQHLPKQTNKKKPLGQNYSHRIKSYLFFCMPDFQITDNSLMNVKLDDLIHSSSFYIQYYLNFNSVIEVIV